MRRSCSSNGRSASISRTTTSAKRMALSASATESFSSFSSIFARLRSPAVSWRRRRRSRHVRSTAMASRVMPASGPVSSRSSPTSRLISVDLPVLGRPTTATRIGASGARSGFAVAARIRRRRGLVRQRRAQRRIEIGEPLAMLGRDRDRIAEAEPIGLDEAGFRRPALALVGDQDRRLAGPAHQIGKGAVGRRRSGARVDQEEHRVGGGDGGLGLRLHAAGEAFGGGLIEAGGVDHREGEIADPRAPFAPVAGDAGAVVHQGETLADQAIEQRRLADVRRADNGDREAHERPKARSRASRRAMALRVPLYARRARRMQSAGGGRRIRPGGLALRAAPAAARRPLLRRVGPLLLLRLRLRWTDRHRRRSRLVRGRRALPPPSAWASVSASASLPARAVACGGLRRWLGW